MRSLVFLGFFFAGCTPLTSAYLSLPIEATDPAGVELAVIRISLDELRRHLEAPEANQFAVYSQGSLPLPHVLVDRDGDGSPDELMLKLDVPAAGLRLAIVSPGPESSSELPPGGREAAVIIRFDHSRR